MESWQIDSERRFNGDTGESETASRGRFLTEMGKDLQIIEEDHPSLTHCSRGEQAKRILDGREG
jgi:hypothetical protein